MQRFVEAGDNTNIECLFLFACAVSTASGNKIDLDLAAGYVLQAIENGHYTVGDIRYRCSYSDVLGFELGIVPERVFNK